MRLSTAIEGAAELDAKLKALPKKVEGKISRQALRAAAKIVQKRAERDAPRRAGGKKKSQLLAKSIKVRAAKRKRGRVAVNVAIGRGWFKGPTFYAAFVELGHKVGKRARAAKNKLVRKIQKLFDRRKKVEGKHFMQRAFDETKLEALHVVTEKLHEGIQREAGS